MCSSDLAKCCALGRGMAHNAERAEALVSEAAEKGNYEARFLFQLINDWKGKERIDLGCLRLFSRSSKWKPHVDGISTGGIKGECTIERVALVMNIVPCRELILGCQT